MTSCIGNAVNNILNGGAGRQLFGFDGDDMLIGGRRGHLTGGAGKDTFRTRRRLERRYHHRLPPATGSSSPTRRWRLHLSAERLDPDLHWRRADLAQFRRARGRQCRCRRRRPADLAAR